MWMRNHGIKGAIPSGDTPLGNDAVERAREVARRRSDLASILYLGAGLN